jgi:OOP family OmpA-OmpF porin
MTDVTETASPDNGAWSELRRALLQPEQDKLAEFAGRFDDPERHAEEVSEVLPQAIVLRSAKDKRLAKALQPTFEEALRTSIKKDPRPFIDAVSPVMGAAIRKAISEALGAMMESLNRTLNQSFSVQSLKWRMEAARTGKPYPEIVMLHTMEYRVEQVFLIHRETSLILQHAVAENLSNVQDADMASGMLTAIQDFARDAANAGESETLTAAKIGDLTLFAEQMPQAILAGYIRGVYPPELRLVFQDALESIQLEFHDALNEFQGDAEPFAAARPHLESCLQVSYADAKKEGKKGGFSPALAAILGVVGLALLAGAFFYWRSYSRWQNYVARLRNTPGLVVVKAEHGLFGCAIEGLRDPLAVDPNALLGDYKLRADGVTSRWDAYQALQPAFIEQRARRLLEPPASVGLRVENGALRVQGAASPEWLAEARKLARGLAGVNEFVYEDQAAVIAQMLVRFPQGDASLSPANIQEVRHVTDALRQLSRQSPNWQLELTGHTDDRGTAQENQSLSLRRAETVREALVAAGLPADKIATRGTGASEPVRADKAGQDDNRSVSFRVRLP